MTEPSQPQGADAISVLMVILAAGILFIFAIKFIIIPILGFLFWFLLQVLQSFTRLSSKEREHMMHTAHTAHMLHTINHNSKKHKEK